MSDDGGGSLAVDEFTEYCRTQAGLLSGSIERMREEADALLDEIDEGAAEVRARLDARTEAAETTAGGDAPTADADLGSIAELETDLEEKQAVVEAKQARMTAFRELATDYVELADELRSEVDDGREALDRVVRFEVERDAPAYFGERQTVCEAASDADDADAADTGDENDADAG